MLKTKVELVTGFLGSGKTSFINALLTETLVWEEKIVVLQLEGGEETLAPRSGLKTKITYLPVLTKPLTSSFLKNIIVAYEPDRLIIEYNGMYVLEDLLDLFNESQINSRASISTLFNIVEGPSFTMYWQNLSSFLLPTIEISHMIMVTKSHLMTPEEEKKVKDILEITNSYGHILFVKDKMHMTEIMKDCTLLDKGWAKGLRISLANQLKRLLPRNGGLR